MNKNIFAIVSLSIIMIFTGCITVNVPLGGGETTPSFQWQIEWEPPSEIGSQLFINPLRVKDLDASGSYQITGIVVKHSDGTIAESSNNRWVGRPGAMLSENLSRDLLIGGNFPAIFRTAASVDDIVTVEGYVREFGATQIDSLTWIAVLDVDVTLLGTRGSSILMQKNYRYERNLPEPGFQILAEQMSELGALWADSVISDFERILPQR